MIEVAIAAVSLMIMLKIAGVLTFTNGINFNIATKHGSIVNACVCTLVLFTVLNIVGILFH